jgi:hypothetical protein
MNEQEGSFAPKPVVNDEELVTRCKALIEQAKQAKRGIEADWKKYRRYYEGYQWKKGRASWKSNLVINVVFSTIETILPLLTDDIPLLIASPRNEEAYRKSEIVTGTMRFLWGKLEIDETLERVLDDGLIYGTGIFKVGWDTEAEPRLLVDPATSEPMLMHPETGEVAMRENPETGEVEVDKEAGREQVLPIGEVRVTRLSPFFLFPDPCATSLDDAAYIIDAKPVDMTYIKKHWPDKAHLIQTDQLGLPESSSSWGDDVRIVDLKHDRAFTSPGDKEEPTKRARVVLYEMWVKDPGLLVDARADVAAEYEKYPGGRVITMASGVILHDRANPFADGHYPYALYQDYPLNDAFWAMGEVQQLLTLQQELNARAAQIVENAQMTGNPQWLVPTLAGIDRDTLNTRPGNYIPYNHPFKPEPTYPAQMPNYIFEFFESTKRDTEWISGVHDVTQGRSPAGVTAASAIAELQEAANTKVRKKIRIRDRTLRTLGKLILSRIQQFYNEERQVALSGADGGLQFPTLWSDVLQGYFDIELETSTAWPVSRSTMFQQVLSLGELGWIDVEAGLKALKWQDRDKIIARNKQREEEQKQMQMAQAQGTPPQGGPGPQGPPAQQGETPPVIPGMEGLPPDLMPPGDMPPEVAQQMMMQMQQEVQGG